MRAVAEKRSAKDERRRMAAIRRRSRAAPTPGRPTVSQLAAAEEQRVAMAKQTASALSAPGALDYPLIAIVATLLAVGLAMVYSASMARAQLEYANTAYFFIRQIGWLGAGLAVAAIMTVIPYRLWQRLAIPIMLVALAALAAVLFLGQRHLGAQRTLLGNSIQPSEFAKLAVVIYVAAWVASKKNQLAQVQGGLIPFAIMMGIVAGLIVLEPSLSVTIIVLVIGITIFFVGGGNAKQLAFSGLVAAGVLALLIWRSDYAAGRVESWWATLNDPTLARYDVAQAMDIIRRGGGIDTNTGNFMLKGNVPLLWSDYLFANVGADLGFVGTMAVIVMFALLGYRGLGIALGAPDQFGSLAAIGVTTWMLTQAMIHIAAATALIPTTGVPLPFMSYGGSAMVANMAAVGLLLSIARGSPQKRAPYASLTFGWWHRRPRRAASVRGQGSEPERRTKPARGPAAFIRRHRPAKRK